MGADGACADDPAPGDRTVNILLPIVFAAVAVGLTVRRMTPAVWGGLLLWVALVVAFNFVKH